MELAQIRLQSSPSTISLKTTQPVQSIEQSKAVLDIKQPPAEMNIEHRPSFLSIDQLEARADMDLKSTKEEFLMRKIKGIKIGCQDLLVLLKKEMTSLILSVVDIQSPNMQNKIAKARFTITTLPSFRLLEV